MLIIRFDTDEFKYLKLYLEIYLSKKKERPAITPLFNKLTEKSVLMMHLVSCLELKN